MPRRMLCALSVFFLTAFASPLAAQPTPRPACLAGTTSRGTWHTATGVKPPAKPRVSVWYEDVADKTKAEELAVAYETEIWPAIIDRLGMEPPVSDIAVGCNGRGPELDVFLVDISILNRRVGLTVNEIEGTCHLAPVHTQLDHSLSLKELKGAATHEFMHAVQWAYKSKACKTDYGWILDATADWAIDYVYPGNDFEHQHAPWFMDAPEKSLDDTTRKDGSADREYGAYLFFQFLTHTNSPDIVRAVWEATVALPTGLEAVNATIPGGFKTQWPKFAKALWNQEPIAGESFAQWDKMTTTPALAEVLPSVTSADLEGQAEAKTDLGTTLKNLSTSYYHFTFSDEGTRSVLFSNPFYTRYQRGESVRVNVLWKTADHGWAEEDWSSYAYVGLCRDLPEQRALELVIIVSNGEWQPAGGGEIGTSAAPFLKRSSMGCWRYRGEVTMIEKSRTWTGLGRKAEGEYVFELPQALTSITAKMPDIADSLRVGLSSYMGVAGGQYTFDEHYEEKASRCNHDAGPLLFVLGAGAPKGVLMLNPFAGLESSLPDVDKWLASNPRSYSASVVDLQPVTVRVTGPGCSGPDTDITGGLLLTNDPGSPPVAAPSGELNGDFASSDATFRWKLRPESQR